MLYQLSRQPLAQQCTRNESQATMMNRLADQLPSQLFSRLFVLVSPKKKKKKKNYTSAF